MNSSVRIMSKTISFRILLIGCILALAVAEGVLRIAGYHSRVIDPVMFVQNNDPLLPYKLRPGYNGYYGGGHVSITRNGLRSVPSAGCGNAPGPCAREGRH